MFRTGASLVNLVEEASAGRARTFLAALDTRRAAFDWEMDMPVAGSRTSMHFAGVALEEHYCIVAARSRSGLTRLNDELMRMNNEQTNALRSAFKELSLQDRRSPALDSQLYDDLSRANNELINLQRELARKNHDLEKALAEVKTLQGLIPICAQCKTIRDEQGLWMRMEAYIQEHSDARFSHGLCPTCAAAMLKELDAL